MCFLVKQFIFLLYLCVHLVLISDSRPGGPLTNGSKSHEIKEGRHGEQGINSIFQSCCHALSYKTETKIRNRI